MNEEERREGGGREGGRVREERERRTCELVE
jgi:hypothetical protein